MTIDFGSIQIYNPDRGFGFVDRTFLNPNRKVFFHIKKIKRKYTQLAQKLDNGEAFEGINFWYEMETTEKGEQVSKLWLSARDIPQSYTHELCGLIQEVERIWKNIDCPQPNWLDLVTIELVGVDRRNELSIERDELKIQRRAAEEERRREAEAARLRQIEARRERERQEAERRIKLEAERQEQVRIAQARRIAEQQNQIRRICEEIGIETLVHFTHVQNLKSILQDGLIGRSQLEKKSWRFKYNDKSRLEGQPEAICLSISFPNYKMFYKYRNTNPLDRNSHWVVLLLKSSILWEMKCKFYTENAASYNARLSERNGTSLLIRRSL